MRQDYDTEAIKLAKVVDISIDSFIKYPRKGYTKENIDHTLALYREWKDSILNPEPKFRKISSLKYMIQAVFTYYQEASGEDVEYFWQQIKEQNLDYIREDKLRKVIDRGKIKGTVEFDLVIDSLVVAEQIGRITKHEAGRLSEMLSEFEARRKKKI